MRGLLAAFRRLGIRGTGVALALPLSPPLTLSLALTLGLLLTALLALPVLLAPSALLALPALTELLFHLLLELLGLALQHFLLIFFLGSLLLTVALLLSQSLFALGQLVQLFQRVVDLLLLLFGSSCRALFGLVLILFRVELQIEERRQIASRSAATASTPPPPRAPKAT